MHKYALLLFCAVFWGHTQAQTFDKEVWYDGKVVLNDADDTLSGSIRFDLEKNLLELGTNMGVKAYSARLVYSFQIYDEIRKQYRQFYALPYEATSNYEVPYFFELLVHGPLTLLCRERLVVENIPSYGPYGRPYGSYTRQRIVFDFYFGYNTGKIKPFSGNKKEFYTLVKDHADYVKGYAEEQRLHYDDRDDLARIIAYYNSLQRN